MILFLTQIHRELLDKMITDREKLKPFDPSWYSHFMEKHQLEVFLPSSSPFISFSFNSSLPFQVRASRVTPFVNNPGRLVLTDKTIYFQLFNNIDPHPVSNIPLSAVNRICLRRHALRFDHNDNKNHIYVINKNDLVGKYF